jgi:hypothetical protein
MILITQLSFTRVILRDARVRQKVSRGNKQAPICGVLLGFSISCDMTKDRDPPCLPVLGASTQAKVETKTRACSSSLRTCQSKKRIFGFTFAPGIQQRLYNLLIPVLDSSLQKVSVHTFRYGRICISAILQKDNVPEVGRSY